jgi:hypothetical protein
MKMTQAELMEIIERHGKWLRDEEGGERANLSYASLRGANLSYANLSYANLSYASLRGANLSYASLRGANLSYANLSGASLRGASLSDASLNGANLSDASLNGANLSGASLRGANLSYASLNGANLSDASLRGANLRGAVGGNGRMQCLQISPYTVIILDNETVWGGCTKKTAEEWLDYEGTELSESDKKYLETVTKPFISMVLEMNQ